MLYDVHDLSHHIISMDEALQTGEKSVQDLYLREMMSAGRIVHKTLWNMPRATVSLPRQL